MTNDAKCGLVLGMAIVLVIAITFFRGSSAASSALSIGTSETPAALNAAENAEPNSEPEFKSDAGEG